MINKFIRNFIAKRVAGRTDDGIMITLSDPKKVEFQTAMMQDLLMRRGIDPNAIQSEEQLKMIINQIKAMEKAEAAQSGIRNTESAKVFDMEGKEIPKGSKIMGGKEYKPGDPITSENFGATGFAPDNTNLRRARELAETDLPPPGSRGGKDDIAAPVQSKEETLKNIIDEEQAAMEKSYGLDEVYDKGLSRKVDMEASNKKIDERNKIIKAKLEKQNKDSVKRILERKNREDVYGLEDYDTTNMSEIKKEIIRTETKLGNLNPDDPNFRAKAKPLVDKIEALKNKMRDDKADGGIMRLGLKEGSGMSRRTFLKFLAGAASIPIVGKIFKPFKIGKKVTQVPIIKTDKVAGKPEWFDQLVNKVILEGDDVTKRFATKDREIVHMKKLDDDTNVMVTQDLDEGAVRVEYQSLDNMYEDPVQLRYKKPKPDEGDPRPSAEFDTAESGPVGRADGPDDYSIEIDEVGGTSISDLTSDVSKLKEYATGKKQTLKEFVQSKKRKDKARRISEGGENEMDEVIRRQGEFIENDLVDLDPFASGGIARMLGE